MNDFQDIILRSEVRRSIKSIQNVDKLINELCDELTDRKLKGIPLTKEEENMIKQIANSLTDFGNELAKKTEDL